MKTLSLLIIFILSTYIINAQRCFYIENGIAGERDLKNDLLKSSQFIAKSPFMSDCIIKTESFQSRNKGTVVKIILQDSATFKTIFQAKQQYSCTNFQKENAALFLNLAMKNFIGKYISQIIFLAENNNRNTLRLLLKEKKDKT